MHQQRGAKAKSSTKFVDHSANALQKESMMRRNKLTLEHIMHERGKNVAEDQLLAKLHVELRNLESREKGPTEVITVSRAISK